MIHVVAAAMIDDRGRVLLQQRHADTHQGGLWEFPGGKLASGEPLVDGLARELHEELGVEIRSHRPLIRVHHDYTDRKVLLDVHLVEAWQGEAQGREGQPLAWVEPEALTDYPMPAADVPVVTALQLPGQYLITPPQLHDCASFLRGLTASLDRGIRLVQLRLFDLPESELRRVGTAACRLCHQKGARVLFNGSLAMATEIGADGLHLNSRQLYEHETRPAVAPPLLAASCHSPDDLAHAGRLGVDFALLSPVLPTRSHPDADPLGWARFSDWVELARMPVFALGGMTPGLLQTAWAHGAQGVAGIRGLWADEQAG